MKACEEKEKRFRRGEVAKRLSLRNCSDPELKAWALAHVTEKVVSRPHTPCMLTVDKPSQETFCHRLCGFIPTEDGIGPLLEMIHLEPDDVFYDLGCGDGRIVIEVVKHFRCHGIGVEINRLLVQKGQSHAESEFADDAALLAKTSFVEEDISRISLSNARVVYIYMPNSALYTLLTKVLPHCGLQEGTVICIKDNWVREEDALRNCKHTSSHWAGGIHCYKWQKATANGGYGQGCPGSVKTFGQTYMM
jgi:SAM-dependent methyltransferase